MAVSESEILSIELPCNEQAPGTVRDALDESTETDWVLGDAMLIANELVTNAVLHSGCSGDHVLQVDVTRQPERLLIRVRDPGLSGTEVSDRQPGSDGGWGLVIVDELAQRWGAERAEGYSVWAEIALPA
ncbi:MAG TPA: ATP-binding protein [Solirubrobacteraceae bacterium]|jgi:anti-sigma regulatory factor (Ser/Thr protein kinase)